MKSLPECLVQVVHRGVLRESPGRLARSPEFHGVRRFVDSNMEGRLYLVSCPDDRVDTDSYIAFLKQEIAEEKLEVEFPCEEECAKGVQRFVDSLRPESYTQTARWDRWHSTQRHITRPLVPGCRVLETADLGVETREAYIQRITQSLEPQCGKSLLVLMPQPVLDDISELASIPHSLALVLVSQSFPAGQPYIKRQVKWSEFQTFRQQSGVTAETVRESLHDMRLAIVDGVRRELGPRSADLNKVLRAVDACVAAEAAKVEEKVKAMPAVDAQREQKANERMMKEVRSHLFARISEFEAEVQSLHTEKLAQLKRDLEQELSARLPTAETDSGYLRTEGGDIASVSEKLKELGRHLKGLANSSGTPCMPLIMGVSCSETCTSIIVTVMNESPRAISGVDLMLSIPDVLKIRENLTLPPGTTQLEISVELIPCNAKEVSMYLVKDNEEMSNHEAFTLEEGEAKVFEPSKASRPAPFTFSGSEFSQGSGRLTAAPRDERLSVQAADPEGLPHLNKRVSAVMEIVGDDVLPEFRDLVVKLVQDPRYARMSSSEIAQVAIQNQAFVVGRGGAKK